MEHSQSESFNYNYNQSEHSRIEDVISEEHEKIEAKISALIEDESLSVNDRRNLYNEVKQEVLGHMEAEEHCFYPEIESMKGVEKSQMLESKEEHHQARVIMDELDDVAVENPKWQAKLQVLCEDLKHHHREEEEEFLSETKDAWSDEKSEEIADRFLKIKRQTNI